MLKPIGFIFRGRHSDELGVGVKSTNRTVTPERRKKEFTILGRSGSLELPSDEYNKRHITVDIGIVNNDKFEDLRSQVRQVASWLSGNGYLIFDDEPTKAYEASVYDAIDLEQWELMSKGVASVTFECQPFAVSKDLNRQLKQGTSSVNLTITNHGNATTCGEITIKNTGSTNINKITITRKVVKQ